MIPGHAMMVFTIGVPWPLPVDQLLHSAPAGTDGHELRLTADPLGRLVASICKDGVVIMACRSQELRLEGTAGLCVLAVWGTEMQLLLLRKDRGFVETNISQEPLAVGSQGAPMLPSIRLYPDLRAEEVSSEITAETLFLATIADLDAKTSDGTWYQLLRAAGLLRHLLLDQLLHKANKGHRTRLVFEVLDDAPFSSLPRPAAYWRSLDPTPFPAARTISVKLQDLLAVKVLDLEDQSATVKDLVRACANAKGGVHLGTADSAEEGAILTWDTLTKMPEREPSLEALRGLCRIVLRGVGPLVRAIEESTPGEA